jgi:uncharacterized RDD family membrane protein YckC
MKCPKCQYISFDSQARCRNCGYEFALTVDMAALDLPIQTGDEAMGPFGDLALTDRDGSQPPPAHASASRARTTPAGPRAPQPRPNTSAFDLPLFKDRSIDDDAPLVTPPAVPRTPLSVRRSNPVIGRSSARAVLDDEPVLDLEAPAPVRPPAPLPHAPSPQAPDPVDAASAPAGAPARLAAAILDAVILGSIAAAVLYFTLKVCGLPFSERDVLPPVPFAAFLLLLGGGYFVLFTAAGGQTIGKMAAGIKVVSVHGEDSWSARVPLAASVLRAVGYLVSLLPAGLGFLPALFGAERRAVHDRLADTRVVKA